LAGSKQGVFGTIIVVKVSVVMSGTDFDAVVDRLS
jgi:hypothetical protein